MLNDGLSLFARVCIMSKCTHLVIFAIMSSCNSCSWCRSFARLSLFCHADRLLSYTCQVWAWCALTPSVSNLCLILLCVYVCARACVRACVRVCVCFLRGACVAGPGRERGEFGTPAWHHSASATNQLWASSVSISFSQSMHTCCSWITNENALIGIQSVTHNWSFIPLT